MEEKALPVSFASFRFISPSVSSPIGLLDSRQNPLPMFQVFDVIAPPTEIYQKSTGRHVSLYKFPDNRKRWIARSCRCSWRNMKQFTCNDLKTDVKSENSWMFR